MSLPLGSWLSPLPYPSPHKAWSHLPIVSILYSPRCLCASHVPPPVYNKSSTLEEQFCPPFLFSTQPKAHSCNLSTLEAEATDLGHTELHSDILSLLELHLFLFKKKNHIKSRYRWCMPVILKRWKQDDQEFKASLSN